jgi:hypothetical protein
MSLMHYSRILIDSSLAVRLVLGLALRSFPEAISVMCFFVAAFQWKKLFQIT